MRCRNLVRESRKIMGNCFEVIKNKGEDGAAASATQAACGNTAMDRKISTSDHKLRILCLHGWRTNGEILSMQMAALRANTRMNCVFIDAPFPGKGEPDKGIAFFYPNRPYYEWFYRAKKDSSGASSAGAASSIASSIYENLDESMKYLEDHLALNGPYDGILGFSQGASMVTRLAMLQQKRITGIASIDGPSKFKFNFVILIGGVPPQELADNIGPGQDLLRIPSLHIMGGIDPLLPESLILKVLYKNNSDRVVLTHDEGHNIPSIRTEIYPQIQAFLDLHSSAH